MYYIGIDLGGTNIAVGIVDKDLHICKKGSTPTTVSDPEAIVRDMAALSRRLLTECGIKEEEVAYAGIVSPGILDREAGVIVYASNIAFDNYPIAKRLMEELAVPAVYIENDANGAALGEAKAGAARGSKNSIMVTLGTGVGGGIIIDGKVYKGSNGAAGELGHIVIEKDGVPCPCGRRGCWEMYSSATGLIRMTREKMEKCPDSLMHEMVKKGGKVSGRTAWEASRKGDAAAKEVVDEYISYLTCGLGSMVNIFQPDTIVLGGGVAGERENLLRPLIPAVAADSYGGGGILRSPALHIAELGNDAGIIGAACLGL